MVGPIWLCLIKTTGGFALSPVVGSLHTAKTWHLLKMIASGSSNPTTCGHLPKPETEHLLSAAVDRGMGKGWVVGD